MIIETRRAQSPLTGQGWTATLNKDSAFAHTEREAVMLVATRQLRVGESAIWNRKNTIVTKEAL
jgi:hypothetical protein